MSVRVYAEDREKVDALLENTPFRNCVNKDGNILWFRYDIDDCFPKEQWTEYCDVQDQLRAVGLELGDPNVEHDCISGDLCYTDTKG
jgi:hypothetical protein